MKYFKDVNPEVYSVEAFESLFLAYNSAQNIRLEFLTPEHVLVFILQQNQFIYVAKQYGMDVQHMQIALDKYIAKIDIMPEKEEYDLLLSERLVSLLQVLEYGIDALNKEKTFDTVCKIEIPDMVNEMYRMADTMASYVLHEQLPEKKLKSFIKDLMSAYDSDNTPTAEDVKQMVQQQLEPNIEMTITKDHPGGTVISSGVIHIDPSNMSKDELMEKMMASAKRMMGALNGLRMIQIPGNFNPMEETEEDDEENTQQEQQKEPWEQFTTNLNETWAAHNPLIGREEELQRTIRVLCRKDKNNPLHIGEAGVGKTAIIYGLAAKIAQGDVPEAIQGHQIHMVDMGSIVAGASFHGEFEKRMKEILEGAKRRGKCILYIDEVHNIMNSGGGNGSIDAANLLKPYLEEGSLRFIGSTTYQDYNRSLAHDKAISRRFQQIDIKEPTEEETVLIINGLIERYQKHHGVVYDADAIQYAVEKSHALIADRFLPDKAIDLIDEAGAYRQLHPLMGKTGKPKQRRFQRVDKALVGKILSEVCKIDAKALTNSDNKELSNLSERMTHDIYGQDAAINQVVRSVMMSKAGLSDPEKPLASLLFVGPTGVGKTEVCRVLARELGVELVRFDMSEYTEKHTVSKLIGSPAGYIGYDEGGLLTDAIRKTPNCVLLLDEIEKAHSDIYNILLQVMDYAKLTDNKGNKADFKNVILIMTSNAGAQYAGQAAIGFGGGLSKGQAMMGAVKKTFRPEFLNRLSGTVVFNDMDEHMASLILDKKLRQLQRRLDAKNVKLTLTEGARKHLLQKGYTQQYGAREMDRALSQHLMPLLMDAILFGKLSKGGEAKVDVSGEELALQ